MTEFEKIVLEKLDNLSSEISGMKGEISGMKGEMSGMKGEISGMKGEMSTMKGEMSIMKDDIIALKRTAIMTETELVPKVNLLLDCYTSLAEKVTISNETAEEVKTLRYEVDVMKKVLQIS